MFRISRNYAYDWLRRVMAATLANAMLVATACVAAEKSYVGLDYDLDGPPVQCKVTENGKLTDQHSFATVTCGGATMNWLMVEGRVIRQIPFTVKKGETLLNALDCAFKDPRDNYKHSWHWAIGVWAKTKEKPWGFASEIHRAWRARVGADNKLVVEDLAPSSLECTAEGQE